MKYPLQKLWVGFSVLFFLAPSAYTYAKPIEHAQKVRLKAGSPDKQAQKLRDVLEELKKQYKVDILFDGGFVDLITVPAENLNYSEEFETNLKKVLRSTELQYKRVKKGSYLILKPKKEAAETRQEASRPAPAPVRENSASFQNEAVVPAALPVTEVADINISGKVTDQKGEGIPGVNILVKGTSRGVNSEVDGTYKISVQDQSAILVFSSIGYKSQEIPVNNLTEINVKLADESQVLGEVVVTGYTSQQKKDIIGSVSVVKASDLNATPSANIVAQLQGRAAGVTVSSTGDPGSSASIRIRGFSSYGNNNPLYVIDGVPTTDGSRINSQDIESIQVLKDASSASIYGARAANGVIIITTKQGKPGRTSVSYDTYVGFQALPLNRIPKLLNTSGLMSYLEKTTAPGTTDPVFGANGAFTIPEYYVVSNGFKGGVSATDPRANPDLYSIADYNNVYQIFKTSEGTNWFDAMSQKGIIQSHQISASGGTEKSNFSLGLNYFNQDGTFKNTGYDRYSVRVNSSFKPTSFFSFGENVQISYDNRTGDDVVIGQESGWANAYRSPSFVPVYDIKGGYGGSLIGGTSGTSWNPVAMLDRRKDWKKENLRAFGNIFADLNFTKEITFRSSIGIDAKYGMIRRGYLKEYERNEARKVTQWQETASSSMSWTWSNTLTFQKKIADKHDVKVLLGSEAIKNTGRGIFASKNNFDSENSNFLSLNTGLLNTLGDITANNPSLFINTLFSYFGRADYTFKDRYLVNATFRRDGSSLFGSSVRYALFPSVGAGWRISEESFMKRFNWLDEAKIRAGWGRMGSISNVPALNQYGTYSSSPTANYYDLNGVNAGSTQGYGASTQGNANTKWESTETINIGADASILNGRWNMAIDIYRKDTRDLLVPSLRNGMEMLVTKPLVNLGSMRNQGIDLQIGNRGQITNDLKYDVSVTFTRYKNRLTKLNDENTAQIVAAERLNTTLITTQGAAVSSFYGYAIDGFYNTQEEVDNGLTINGAKAVVGTWKYKDLNGDGNITTADRTILGSPHPDFQTGVNLGLTWKNIDFSTFLFWNQGNQIFNYTKFYTYMGVLGGGIASAKLTDAWTPETASTAKTPRLAPGSANGYTSFVTGNPTSFYVEDGSYLRAKNLQIGYTFPKSIVSKLKMSNLRIYAQVQNLFTLTKYSGADPDLGLVSGTSTNQTSSSDQNIGVDYAGYPNPRQFLMGLNLSF